MALAILTNAVPGSGPRCPAGNPSGEPDRSPPTCRSPASFGSTNPAGQTGGPPGTRNPIRYHSQPTRCIAQSSWPTERMNSEVDSRWLHDSSHTTGRIEICLANRPPRHAALMMAYLWRPAAGLELDDVQLGNSGFGAQILYRQAPTSLLCSKTRVTSGWQLTECSKTSHHHVTTDQLSDQLHGAPMDRSNRKNRPSPPRRGACLTPSSAGWSWRRDGQSATGRGDPLEASSGLVRTRSLGPGPDCESMLTAGSQ